ncbi:hypothetical protein B0T22DRAFT_61822 [Podospora appendiculata]|uniref:Uncharacterized protein n=1 Tax=Podospora appendiculata TaxID=314037 RepID=A0AAE1CH98_9PEZI|nr:hypothetical protein B0T22DRAFT_61822 [Podospora appendiculata]
MTATCLKPKARKAVQSLVPALLALAGLLGLALGARRKGHSRWPHRALSTHSPTHRAQLPIRCKHHDGTTTTSNDKNFYFINLDKPPFVFFRAETTYICHLHCRRCPQAIEMLFFRYVGGVLAFQCLSGPSPRAGPRVYSPCLLAFGQ